MDVKDDGVKEMNEYIKINGDINTFTVKTPSGGVHYYFKYTNSNTDTQYLIDEFLTNKSKFRKKGLDIRTNGGLIKAPPSTGYEIFKNVEIIEIPETLVLWLLENVEMYEKDVKTITLKNNKLITGIYKYNIEEEQLKYIVSLLDKSYYTEYSKWLLVLTVFKSISLKTFDTYDIFDEFSKQNKTTYDKNNNMKFWNNNGGVIDINYLIKRINKEQKKNLKIIEKFKPVDLDFKPDPKIFKFVEFNKKYLEYQQEVFNNNETILIQSTTGTGKTTSTAKYVKCYIDNNPNIRFLSLVNLIKLNEQQLETFKNEGLKLVNYQESTDKELKNNNIICCLNSIHNKLRWLDDEENLKNYIVYIDEITSFIESLIHNDKLNNSLQQTYLLLMSIIKKCHKLILSDAILTPNVLNLIDKREKANKIFIKNTFQKYKAIEAIRQNDENLFLDKIRDHIKNDNYFLFGADSKTVITKYFNETIKQFDSKKDNFILITADTVKKIKNVKEEFKNKFVFFSPSITTGLDFSIPDKQDVFLYIKGKTINPASSFQQATRTRNINKIYYYSCCQEKKPVYSSVEEVEETYKNRIETNEKLLNLSGSIDEDDNIKIVKNTFSKLFYSSIYQQDAEQTNKLLHIEEIFEHQGMNVIYEGVDKKELDASTKSRLTKEYKKIKDETIEKFIFDVKNEVDIYSIDEYKVLRERQDYLNLNENELSIYSFLINDEYKYNSFFSFIKIFQTTEYLESKLKDRDSFKVKKLDDTENKIILLRKFEKANNINTFDLDFSSSDVEIKTDDNTFKLLKTTFRISKTKPENTEDLKKFYIGMIRHIFNSLDIVIGKKTKNKERKDIIKYSFNDGLIKLLFNLIFKLKIKNLDSSILKVVNIEIPQNYLIERVDEEFQNTYLFGKK